MVYRLQQTVCRVCTRANRQQDKTFPPHEQHQQCLVMHDPWSALEMDNIRLAGFATQLAHESPRILEVLWITLP